MAQLNELNITLMDEDLFSKTIQVINKGIQNKVTPGMVAGFLDFKKSDQLFVYAVGKRSVTPFELPMLAETVFDLASVSKIISTTALCAVLVQRGWLNWNTKVQAIFPLHHFKDITVAHLLSHTAGFAAWDSFYLKLEAKFQGTPIYQVPVHARQMEMRNIRTR